MDRIMEIPWWIPTAVMLAGLSIGYYMHLVLTKLRMTGAERTAQEIENSAALNATVILQDAKLKAQEAVIDAQQTFKEESRSQREDMQAREKRTAERESNLERKVAMLDKKEAKIESTLLEVEQVQTALSARDAELSDLVEKEKEKIQQVAEMSQDEAREVLMKRMEEDVRAEAGTLIRHVQEEIRENSEKEARHIISLAIERYAADQVNDITACSVQLPNDEMKGRIIGREGRNIRSLEAATGVNILIDDTPEVVVISGFDPLRREVARIALERLISDGRIHPGRIEEMVDKVREEIDQTVRKAGEQAIYDVGLQHIKPELVSTLGRLKFRHSYAQNVLTHSIEMAHIMGMMAAEMGLDQTIAKRIGLCYERMVRRSWYIMLLPHIMAM